LAKNIKKQQQKSQRTARGSGEQNS